MKKSIIFLLFVVNLNAQSLTIKVLDSLSLSPIPFATVYFSNGKGIITNERGKFELIEQQFEKKDTLFISSMGYKKVSLALDNFNDSIIYMTPKLIELGNVIITNRNLSSKEIIEKVKKGIDKNYQTQLSDN